MSVHLLMSYLRMLGYASLATSLVYVTTVMHVELGPARAKLFVATHSIMAMIFYLLSILAIINTTRYSDPPHTSSLFVMDWILTPLLIGGTVFSWWFSFRQTRREVGVQRLLHLLF